MTDIEVWKKSLENDINTCDEFLQKAKPINELIPIVEERKRETKAKLNFVNNMPEEFLSDVTATLLPIQLNDEIVLKNNLPWLPSTKPGAISAVSSTAGSTSAYLFTYNKIVNSGYQPDTRMMTVIDDFHSIADEKEKSEDLPLKLDLIIKDLGKMFILAKKSFGKAKAKMVTVSQTATTMRDVIQYAWGGITGLARRRNPEALKKLQHPQLKKESNRKLVVDCLANDAENKAKFELLLGSMSKLYKELSEGDFGKNPMSNDLPRIKDLYRIWILQLDDLVKLVNPVVV
jgi:hypothetical protein